MANDVRTQGPWPHIGTPVDLDAIEDVYLDGRSWLDPAFLQEASRVSDGEAGRIRAFVRARRRRERAQRWYVGERLHRLGEAYERKWERAVAQRVLKRLPNFDPDLGTRYSIVTAADEKVCPICSYMEEVGSFAVADAMTLIEDFHDEQELVGGIDSLSAFLTEADVALPPDTPPREGGGRVQYGPSIEELTSRGAILPPFHVNCRCGVVLG